MQPFSIALALIFTAALLVTEHIGMHDQPWHLDPPWNYVIGVATLAAGWIVWALTTIGPVTPIDAVVSIILISFGSGAVVVLCYAVRGRIERGKKNNNVVAQAERLTQDIIDGGRHAAGKPSIHDPSRRN